MDHCFLGGVRISSLVKYIEKRCVCVCVRVFHLFNKKLSLDSDVCSIQARTCSESNSLLSSNVPTILNRLRNIFFHVSMVLRWLTEIVIKAITVFMFFTSKSAIRLFAYGCAASNIFHRWCSVKNEGMNPRTIRVTHHPNPLQEFGHRKHNWESNNVDRKCQMPA